MGCCVASELFHETLGKGLEGLDNVDHHIDDILIMSDSIKSGKIDIINCFQRLDDLNLTINPDKLAILQEEIEYWGLLINQTGVRPIKDKIEALKNSTNPKNAKEVLSLLSSLSYYIDRIPYLSTLAIPLRELSTSKNHFKWLDHHSNALQEIKNSIIETALDHYDPFDPNTQLELWVDAGPKGTGAFLVQNKNNMRSLIACASKTHSPAQMNYSHVEKECESCVWSCMHFRDELIGRKFTLFTDNESASKILNPFSELKKMTTYRMQLWRSNMTQFSGINIQHIPGEKNMADYLSRCLADKITVHSNTVATSKEFAYDDDDMKDYVASMLTIKHYIKTLTLNDIATETMKDPILKLIIESIKAGNKYLPKSKHFGHFKSLYNEISLSENNILMYNDVIIIPDSLRQRLIDLTHEGHMGINSCKSLIRNNYYFKDLDQMMAYHAKTCHPCQTVTDTSHYEPIIPTNIPCTKNSHWDIDFKSHTPSNDSILVIIDEATEYPILITTKSQTADAAISALKQVFKKYGMPKNIKSDNGPAFNSVDFKNFMKGCNINYQPITPVWPRANGTAERFMRNINRVIRCALVENKNWKNEMVKYLNNYRATPHSMTKVTPNEAMNLKDTVKFPTINRPQRQNLTEVISKNNKFAKDRMKFYGDKHLKVKPSTFKKNDLVLVKYDKNNTGTVGKYNPIFDPVPYRVKDKNGSMIKAERANHEITRNSQFFRHFYTKSNATLEPLDIQIKPTTDIIAYPLHFTTFGIGRYVPRCDRTEQTKNVSDQLQNNEENTVKTNKNTSIQSDIPTKNQSKKPMKTNSDTTNDNTIKENHQSYLLNKTTGSNEKTNKNYTPVQPQSKLKTTRPVNTLADIENTQRIINSAVILPSTSQNIDQFQVNTNQISIKSPESNTKSSIKVTKLSNKNLDKSSSTDDNYSSANTTLLSHKKEKPVRQLFKNDQEKVQLKDNTFKITNPIESDHESSITPDKLENTAESIKDQSKTNQTLSPSSESPPPTPDQKKKSKQKQKTKRKEQRNSLADQKRSATPVTPIRTTRSKSKRSISQPKTGHKSALNGTYWQ